MLIFQDGDKARRRNNAQLRMQIADQGLPAQNPSAFQICFRLDINGKPVFLECLHDLLIGFRPVMLGQIVSRFVIILLGDIH